MQEFWKINDGVIRHSSDLALVGEESTESDSGLRRNDKKLLFEKLNCRETPSLVSAIIRSIGSAYIFNIWNLKMD